jgi:hypothetical protein
MCAGCIITTLSLYAKSCIWVQRKKYWNSLLGYLCRKLNNLHLLYSKERIYGLSKNKTTKMLNIYHNRGRMFTKLYYLILVLQSSNTNRHANIKI